MPPQTSNQSQPSAMTRVHSLRKTRFGGKLGRIRRWKTITKIAEGALRSASRLFAADEKVRFFAACECVPHTAALNQIGQRFSLGTVACLSSTFPARGRLCTLCRPATKFNIELRQGKEESVVEVSNFFHLRHRGQDIGVLYSDDAPIRPCRVRQALQ